MPQWEPPASGNIIHCVIRRLSVIAAAIGSANRTTSRINKILLVWFLPNVHLGLHESVLKSGRGISVAYTIILDNPVSRIEKLVVFVVFVAEFQDKPY